MDSKDQASSDDVIVQAAVTPPRRKAGRPRLDSIAARHDSILAIALDLFIEHGYANVTLAMLATSAHMAVRTIYIKFGSKDGLLSAMITAEHERHRAQLALLELDKLALDQRQQAMARHIGWRSSQQRLLYLQAIVLAAGDDGSRPAPAADARRTRSGAAVRTFLQLRWRQPRHSLAARRATGEPLAIGPEPVPRCGQACSRVVNTTRDSASLAQCRATCDKGSACVAIAKPPGTAASNSCCKAASMRGSGMLPMPLPINSIGDERKAALGKVMVGALTEPMWTKRIGTASGAATVPATSKASALGPHR